MPTRTLTVAREVWPLLEPLTVSVNVWGFTVDPTVIFSVVDDDDVRSGLVPVLTETAIRN